MPDFSCVPTYIQEHLAVAALLLPVFVIAYRQKKKHMFDNPFFTCLQCEHVPEVCPFSPAESYSAEVKPE